MRNSAPLITILALLLPSASCSVLAKGGINVGAKNPVSKSSPSAPAMSSASPESAASPSASQAAAPMAAPQAPPAPKVADSVPAIPADLAVAPAAGAPIIKLTGASWCSDDVKGLDWEGYADRKFKGAMKNVANLRGSGMDSIRDMARFACGGTQSADRLTWVESYMQGMANANGMSFAHINHLFTVAASKDFEGRRYIDYAPEGCEVLQAPKRANTLEQASARLALVGAGCEMPSDAGWISWDLDRSAEIPTQVHRMGWVYAALAYGRHPIKFNRGIMALYDSTKFDQNQYFSDLKELGADDQVIGRAILRFYEVKEEIGKWTEYYKEELGEEDYGLLVKAAEDGFNGWVEDYQANKAAVDFAFSMEEAVVEGDKRLFEGCSEKASKFAKSYVMRNAPTTKEAVLEGAATPVGSLILAGAYECEKNLGNNLMASVYAQLKKEAPSARGPRFAALLAVGRKVAELKAVKSRFPLDARDFRPYKPTGAFGSTSRGYFQTASGTISNVEKNGDMIKVSFKKDTWKEPVYKCKETNRLDRITDDGKLVYRKICHQTGTKNMSSQESPIEIPAAAAFGIKKGAFLDASRNTKQPGEGIPMQVYTNKNRDTMVNFYGLSLR